jgi:hypothetical protein
LLPLDYFCYGFSQFRIRIQNLELWIRIRQKVSVPCGSGSTTLILISVKEQFYFIFWKTIYCTILIFFTWGLDPSCILWWSMQYFLGFFVICSSQGKNFSFSHLSWCLFSGIERGFNKRWPVMVCFGSAFTSCWSRWSIECGSGSETLMVHSIKCYMNFFTESHAKWKVLIAGCYFFCVTSIVLGGALYHDKLKLGMYCNLNGNIYIYIYIYIW